MLREAGNGASQGDSRAAALSCPPPRRAEEQRPVAWRVSPERSRIPVQGRSEESEQGGIKMEEQGPRRPIQRERLECKGKKPPAGQVGTIRDLLPRADLCQIKQEPEEGQPQQHWEAQKQDFLKTMQPPRSGWETPQAPSPPQSGDGVLPFRGAADASWWPSGRAGGTDQTLLPDTEGLLGKETAAGSFGISWDIKLTSNSAWSKQETLVDQWLRGLTVPTDSSKNRKPCCIQRGCLDRVCDQHANQDRLKKVKDP
uniref:uncharacterized protein LOC114592367 isoform X1 n=1 Tax=Podarcis muralis TaxID=64176 RepID=UPI00109FFD05|nr:uncharacterized protein LOC114592367 isoform X1 [Podarcis muralis]